MNKKEQQVCSPFDGSLIHTISLADAQDVESALTTAFAAFSQRKQWLSVEQRITILKRFAALIEENADDLIRIACLEGGKPLLDTKIEHVRCVDSIQICIDTLRHQTPKAVHMGSNAASHHRLLTHLLEPIGVVVAVSAFNHPLNLIAHQVGPAVAAGCPVIIKPAQDTPLSCLALVKLLHEAGLPQMWCQCIVPETTALAERMVTDSRVAFFSFIGSAQVGWYLRSKLAAGTRCALEHGGVAPVIVEKDVDIAQILPSLMKGAFYHAGQVCVSVQRIFVHRALAQDLTQAMRNAAQDLQVGNPLDEHTEVGPLIRAGEVQRVDTWVQEAVAAGAELCCGGKVLANQCYAPTVLFNPPVDAKVSTHELFGPVVCIYAYDDLDAAIAQANRLDMAFQAAVFCQDIDLALSIASQLDASAVMVNEHTAFRVDWMPFSGLKHSGLGVGGIPHTIQDMQNSKMIVINRRG